MRTVILPSSRLMSSASCFISWSLVTSSLGYLTDPEPALLRLRSAPARDAAYSLTFWLVLRMSSQIARPMPRFCFGFCQKINDVRQTQKNPLHQWQWRPYSALTCCSSGQDDRRSEVGMHHGEIQTSSRYRSSALQWSGIFNAFRHIDPFKSCVIDPGVPNWKEHSTKRSTFEYSTDRKDNLQHLFEPQLRTPM